MEACKRTGSGKCSRRRRPSSISCALAVLSAGITIVSSVGFSQTDTREPIPAGSDLLRRFLEDTRTLRADFRQELLGPDREIIETATGSMALRRPGRFAWHYAAPIEQLVLADGENLWIYDADLAQATVMPLGDAAPASPAMLLSGEASLDAEFEVLEEFAADGTSWVRLAPKPDGTDFKQVLVGFRNGLLSDLQLLDSLDQMTLLEFSDVEIGMELPDSEFEFVLPPDVDLIGEAG